jgi:hypothetical protein
MKLILFLTLCFALDATARPWTPTETANPVQDHADFHKLSSGRVVYKWEVDLNHDGKKDILLDTKETPAEIDEEEKETRGEYDPNIRNFAVYIPNPKKADYIQSKGMDIGSGQFVVGGAPGVDITQCYVGYITQLKRWGLVTIQTDDATDKAPAAAYIYAYTIEGDHIKRALLAKYNPDKGGNAICDQYLKEDKRTKVQLQEVTP